eukprot:scaffold1522_cov340-Prasinococcus_capsulatus_cf.AAC.8
MRRRVPPPSPIGEMRAGHSCPQPGEARTCDGCARVAGVGGERRASAGRANQAAGVMPRQDPPACILRCRPCSRAGARTSYRR